MYKSDSINILQNTKAILWGLLLILGLVFTNVFIYNHYSSFLPPHNNLGAMMLLFNLGITLIAVSVYYYHELVNPFTFIGLFIMQWGISFLQISVRQVPFNLLSIGVAAASILFLCIGILISSRFYYKKRIFLSNSVQYYLFWSCFYLGIIVFFLEVAKVGYFPFVSILQSRNPAAYNAINASLIPLLHYLVLLHSILPILAVVLYKRCVITKRAVVYVVLISIFITLNYLSRQAILLILISIFLYFNYQKKIGLFRISVALVAMILLFGIFGNLRSHTNTLDEANNFLKFYSDIKLNTSLFDTYLTLYSSLNFDTFNKMINTAFNQSYLGGGIHSLKPIISLTFLDRIGIVDYPVKYDSFVKLGTFMADPFLDFGFVGTVVINLFYGWFCGLIFNSYEQKKGLLSIVNWAIIAFCLIMLPFVNYFNNFFVWFFLIIINLFAVDEDIRLHSHL